MVISVVEFVVVFYHFFKSVKNIESKILFIHGWPKAAFALKSLVNNDLKIILSTVYDLLLSKAERASGFNATNNNNNDRLKTNYIHTYAVSLKTINKNKKKKKRKK